MGVGRSLKPALYGLTLIKSGAGARLARTISDKCTRELGPPGVLLSHLTVTQPGDPGPCNLQILLTCQLSITVPERAGRLLL